jgi:RNA polymerase sigma factor (sigma-70 family)
MAKKKKKNDPGPREQRPDLAATYAALVRVAGGGGQAACDELIMLLSRFRRGLIVKLRRWVGRRQHDAEDAVADMLLELYQKTLSGDFWQPPRNWWGFLLWRARRHLSRNRMRAARYKLLELYMEQPEKRRRAKGQKQGASLEQEAIVYKTPYNRVAAKDEFEHLLVRASERLSPAQRKVFFARASGLMYAEIAEIVGAKLGSARVLSSKARKLLGGSREVA